MQHCTDGVSEDAALYKVLNCYCPAVFVTVTDGLFIYNRVNAKSEMLQVYEHESR
jgi:hypothetical protein